MRLAVLASAAAFASVAFTVSPAATPLRAQAPGVAPACDPNTSISKELATPWFNFTRAQSATTPEAKRPFLSNIMKDLGEKPERYAKNPFGYNWVLSQALTMWLLDPSVGIVTTRGKLGFTTAPEQPYDIVEHIDSAFTAIVAVAPNCAQEMSRQRQNDGWLSIVRKSLDMSNNNQNDSAVYYANQSLRLSKDSPYPYYVLAASENSKANYKAAVGHWKKLLEVAGTDTLYNTMRLSSYYYLGMRQGEIAAAETGDAQKATAADAANWLAKYLAETPTTSPDLPNVMQALADGYEMAGKPEMMNVAYKAMLANPTAYDDFALTMGGVIATRAKDVPSSLILFQAAVTRNPWSRDALRNLSATYYAKNEFDKMWTPLKALVQLDPNNTDAWLMHAYAAQGLAKDNKNAVEKKAWTDTLVKYSNFADNLPAKVEITGFQRGKEGSNVTISVEQVATAAGNYNVTMEFLDAKGAVVATEQKQIGPIEKGARKKETFKTTNGTVMSFRYKPLG